MANDLIANLNSPAERRKQVRLRVRPDLQAYEQKYEGKTFHVVKDPVCLRYYRFSRQEYFVFRLFDGRHTMEEVQEAFEGEFKPLRLEPADLEGFARQLVTAGLVQNEQPGAARHLFERRAKQRRLRRLATLTNVLYMKIPVFDPDRLLTWMYGYLWWVFTTWFFVASVTLMLAAVGHVVLHFGTFRAKLPAYQEFFTWNSVLYMWLSLGIVKVIHEFGHGLSCKAFRGECHEMGVLLMCLSPALYANVTDAWTVADKWKRIIISFAGIYVELVIAAVATFVWWYTPAYPTANNIALCLMVLCSVSTIVFNANPLMRFDGYYILADWLEVPNLREKANRFLNNLFLSKCLGIEVPPEPYMAPWRKWLFLAYSVGSWVYRWVVTFSILWFLADFLPPKLKVLSQMLAIVSLASLFIWPAYKVVKNIRQRGRLPDMKAARVYVTLGVLGALVLAFFFLPLPVGRVHETGLLAVDPDALEGVMLPEPARLVALADVGPGQQVRQGQALAQFKSEALEVELARAQATREEARATADASNAAAVKARNMGDSAAEQRFLAEYKKAKIRAQTADEEVQRLVERRDRVREMRAPRGGTLVTVPKRDEIGKLFDRGYTDAAPVFAVGDPTRMIVKVPVNPPSFRVLREDLKAKGELTVAIYAKGRSDHEFVGRVRRLPEQNAATVPLALTQRGGGSLAVRPNDDPNVLAPLAQVYIVEVEIADADAAIHHGQLAVVKVHTRWRSGAWWVARALSNAMDLGFY
jgi:putative peptide zinc metalloprotease protein